MERKLIAWSLIAASILLLLLDWRRALAGITQFLLPVALLALGVDLFEQKSPRKATLALAAVTAVLAAVAIVRRLL